MSDRSPNFKSPPVVETVLSLQFAPLKEFTSAHAGLFWRNYLSDRWTFVRQDVRIDDQFERFSSEKRWMPKGSSLTFVKGHAPQRVQIIRDDNERMIQVQDTRFIYNWRKQEGEYPRYEKILPKFKKQYGLFVQFVRDQGWEIPQLNQWEITYVNHILRGEAWHSPEDWPKIFPWFSFPALGVGKQSADGFTGEWHLTIGDNLGRLHIKLNHVRIGSESGKEAVALQLTARGPIGKEQVFDLDHGFDNGHASIVWSFADMISEDAYHFWGGRPSE